MGSVSGFRNFHCCSYLVVVTVSKGFKQQPLCRSLLSVSLLSFLLVRLLGQYLVEETGAFPFGRSEVRRQSFRRAIQSSFAFHIHIVYTIICLSPRLCFVIWTRNYSLRAFRSSSISCDNCCGPTFLFIFAGDTSRFRYACFGHCSLLQRSLSKRFGNLRHSVARFFPKYSLSEEVKCGGFPANGTVGGFVC